MNIPKIKICGITNITDALLALEPGADFIGFIFYEKSPRWIEPEQAGEIIRHCREKIDRDFKTVGVYVNPARDFLESSIEKSGVDIVQYHGSESPDFIKSINKTSIKAFRIKEPADIIKSYEYNNADFFLFDAYSEKSHGGTGKTFDWGMLDSYPHKDRLFLAGGIGAENVIEAIKRVRPYALDLSSSIESSPGKKDRQKVMEFFRAIGFISGT